MARNAWGDRAGTDMTGNGKTWQDSTGNNTNEEQCMPRTGRKWQEPTGNAHAKQGAGRTWGNAKEDFGNIDKLIDYVNKDGRVQAFYSDPAQYARAKAAENITWTVKTDDFFPYADVPHGFWSGYFTSRPALKRFIRESSSVLQVAKQILGGSSHVFQLLFSVLVLFKSLLVQ